MKTHLLLFSGIALLLSACTTGTMVSSSKGYDDVYFSPGDNPPPTVVNSSPRRDISSRQDINEPSVNSKNSQDRASRIVDEYYGNNQDQSNTYSYNNDNSNTPDSIYEGDENEYPDLENDDSDELSYSTRLRTFYDPYMYDPFWDSYMGWNMGWGFGYGGWYSGWNSPWYYGGWYDPWYAYGWGYPYWGGYYGGYYGSYWGNHHGGYWDHGYGRDRYFGRQNFAGNYGRRSNAVSYGSNLSVRSGNYSNSTYTGRRSAAVAPNYSARQAGSRYTVNPNLSTRSARIYQQQGRSNETLMNLRRSGTRQGYTPTTRSAQVGQDNTQRYTPTYSRPRTNTQATYNNGARDYRQYRYSESSRYAKPGSYSSSPSRYSGSSNSGATFQRRSATTNSQGSYSGRSYSSPSYSAPSRSSESYSAPSRGSFSGGGSYSGGGGSYSGGGGGGGSFSGRRR